MEKSVFVVGATGNVGRTFVSQVLDEGNSTQSPTKIVGLASSTTFIYNPSGLEKEQAMGFAQKNALGSRYDGLKELLGVLRGIETPLNVIDVTASPAMLSFHLSILGQTNHSMVTANKQPLILSSSDEFKALTKDDRRYEYGCSVMAGADAVYFIRDQKRLGEIPAGIIGCFSGTLGYVTSELEKGRNFSEIIREAKERGYTEPNPTVDLSGKDVAYKILILARTAGFDVSVGDIKLSPFIPLDNIPCDNVDLLLEGLKTMDEKLKNDMNSAKANGKTLRYIARTATKKGVLTISVGLENVDKRYSLGQLSGTANKIVIKTGPYGSNGNGDYSIEAPGAGVDITARNVRRGLLRVN